MSLHRKHTYVCAFLVLHVWGRGVALRLDSLLPQKAQRRGGTSSNKKPGMLFSGRFLLIVSLVLVDGLPSKEKQSKAFQRSCWMP
jgi:hypothetical protein